MYKNLGKANTPVIPAQVLANHFDVIIDDYFSEDMDFLEYDIIEEDIMVEVIKEHDLKLVFHDANKPAVIADTQVLAQYVNDVLEEAQTLEGRMLDASELPRVIRKYGFMMHVQ